MSALVRDRDQLRRIGTKSTSQRHFTRRTRILVTSVPRLLRELLRNLIAEEPDLEVVGDAVDPVDVLIATGQTQADVVLLTWPPSGEMPATCTRLLGAYPDLLVIGIRADGRGHYTVHQANVTETQCPMSLANVLAAVRTAVPKASPR
jgi:DNA-binding NarL/FixJ family response regulator